jgi:hypothetical protein
MSGKSGSRKTPNPGWFSKGSCPNPGGRPTASPAPQASVFQVLVEKIRSSMRVSGKCRSTSLRRLLGQTSLKGHSFFNLTISVSLPLTPTEC